MTRHIDPTLPQPKLENRASEQPSLPIRAGVFTSVEAAKQAVQRLLSAGFPPSQITVICSDENKERHFREFEHQEPAGANTPAAAATGGALGATLGGVAAGAVGAVTGGLPLLVAGGIGLMAGAVWGGFLGAMMTRGLEKEAADFYDQAVQAGKILVTVEQSAAEQNDADQTTTADPSISLDEANGKTVRQAPTLQQAAQLLAQSGAEPLPLTSG